MAVVKMDVNAIARMIRSPDGPVMRATAEIATRTQVIAKQRVGVGADPERGGRHLRDRIVKRFIVDSKGPAIALVAEEPHATYHHEGTAPHIIRPVRAKVLRFPVSKGSGTFVYAPEVHHPGTQPNRFLTDAARATGLRVVSR